MTTCAAICFFSFCLRWWGLLAQTTATRRYLCRGLKNPNGIARITLNYEKFLLDKDGVVVRRYPRKLEAADFEADVKVK